MVPGTMCAVACCKNSLKITQCLSKDISPFSKICAENFNAEDFERNLQNKMLNL